MPDSREDSNNSSLTWRNTPSITGSGGRGHLTPEGLTSDTKPQGQQETASAAAPRKRAPPRERSAKKARRPDQQLYVPRRARQSDQTSIENPASVKQSVDSQRPQQSVAPTQTKHTVDPLQTKETVDPTHPNHKTCQKSERLEESAERFSPQTDHRIRSSSGKFETDIFSTPKATSSRVIISLSTKNGNVVDQLLNQEAKLNSSSKAAGSEDTGAAQSIESGNGYIDSQRNHQLSDQAAPHCTTEGSPANDIVLESAKEGFKNSSLNTRAYTPTHSQENACNSQSTDTRVSDNSREKELLRNECSKPIQKAQELSSLLTDEIMDEDVSRLESTNISGSGDENATSGPVEKVTEGARDEVKKEDGGEEEEEDSWDAMFDEEGNSLKEDEIKEITDAVGGVSVSVKKPANDYYSFSPKDTTDYTKLEHVIEAYDFPADFKTEDLVMSFNAFKNKGFDIKWVDDTHALVVFATAQVASDALGLQNPMLRTRPLSLASKQSKQKAKSTVEFIQPYRPRPETSSVAARRMVSNALGVKSTVSKEQRAAERQKLKDAKDRKREEKKQKADMWDGTI